MLGVMDEKSVLKHGGQAVRVHLIAALGAVCISSDICLLSILSITWGEERKTKQKFPH